ncbi:uncharacterized protein LOC108745005 isoform X2 [Agrilus planipennis]|uniref:Uncharacterized protein LOC108745005 isoform X2 n=1 Tax=Agrilus planipennis TaxID=224129 RepID=A0A1W4XVL0_AGRPL|nr:uncharacterized protein LOC108745005 isoform X2 [Agrilus planipennis]
MLILRHASKYAFNNIAFLKNNYGCKLKNLTFIPLIDVLTEEGNDEGIIQNEARIPVKDLNKEVENAVFKGEKFLMKFIPILEEIIVEISRQYRKCIIKQMELTEQALELEIIPIRVQAAELKSEIVKYENLVKSVAQSVYGQAALALMSGDSVKDLEIVQSKLQELEKILENEISENKKVEHKLLAVSCASILQ